LFIGNNTFFCIGTRKLEFCDKLLNGLLESFSFSSGFLEDRESVLLGKAGAQRFNYQWFIRSSEIKTTEIIITKILNYFFGLGTLVAICAN